MFKKILAITVFLAGLISLSVTAKQFKTPDAMFHSPLHKHLVTKGVSFVHRQFNKHIIVLPRAGEPKLVEGYDTPEAICVVANSFQPIRTVTVHGGPEGSKTASCK